MLLDTCRIQNPDIPRGSGRDARRRGGAEPSRTGPQQNCSPRKQASLVPSNASNKRHLNISPEATSEILCKPNALIKYAVDNRFIRNKSARPRALFVLGCSQVDRRLLISVNPFFLQRMPGNINQSNPKPGHTTGRSSRGGARRNGEGGRGWVGRDAVESIRPGDNPPSCSPANRRHCPGRLFGSTNKRNPM